MTKHDPNSEPSDAEVRRKAQEWLDEQIRAGRLAPEPSASQYAFLADLIMRSRAERLTSPTTTRRLRRDDPDNHAQRRR
jgi:hypothetical protein